MKTFKDAPSNLELAARLKSEMEDFKPNLPLIQALRNPGMKERHWTKLSEELGTPLTSDAMYTLNE